MATAILDRILNSQFGKHFIFWVFLALAAANVAQWLHRKTQDKDLKDANLQRSAEQKYYTIELSKCDSLRVEDYKYFYNEINKEKERRINWKKK